jgi:hypothetical protein
MILAAEKILGWQLVPTQGSYNRGGVTASAGTHDGGGAVDFRARDLTATKRTAAVVALRRVGFAAWLRLPTEGNWVVHIHCIAVGDAELSAGAKRQVLAYKAGRNGLANNRADNATRAYVNVTWESYKASLAKPVIHSSVVNFATKGLKMDGQVLLEARRFMAFARALQAIKVTDENYWKAAVAAGKWTDASRVFLQALKNVQYVGHLVVDGKFGPQTGGFVAKHGYNIIYNG